MEVTQHIRPSTDAHLRDHAAAAMRPLSRLNAALPLVPWLARTQLVQVPQRSSKPHKRQRLQRLWFGRSKCDVKRQGREEKRRGEEEEEEEEEEEKKKKKKNEKKKKKKRRRRRRRRRKSRGRTKPAVAAAGTRWLATRSQGWPPPPIGRN
jgi:hypothetical protein